MDTIKLDGQLEIDQQRGVIYFHSVKGYSALRICGLTEHFGKMDENSQIDITLMEYKPGCIFKDNVAVMINEMIKI